MVMELNPQVPGSDQQPTPDVEAGNNEPEAKPKSARAAKPGLPDQKSINPDKIPRAVLSKDGWVVPTGKPRPL